jgi:hypothetical protein
LGIKKPATVYCGWFLSGEKRDFSVTVLNMQYPCHVCSTFLVSI